MSTYSICGQENIPTSGFLLVPDQLTSTNLTHLLENFADRTLAFLVEHDANLNPELQASLSASGHEPIGFIADNDHLEELQEGLRELTDAGQIVVFLPAESPHLPASNTTVRGQLFTLLQQAADIVVPLAIDRPQLNYLCIEEPTELPEATYCFGEPCSSADFPGQLLRNHFIAADKAFAEREVLDISLGWALLQGLKKHDSYILHDSVDSSDTPYGKLLAAALVFAKQIKAATDKDRVAIILPPGRAGMIANLAVVFAGKSPVNINFTAGNTAIESAMSQSGADRFISADPFVRRSQSFPWPPNKQMLLIERILPPLKKEIAVTYILSKILPAKALAKIYHIDKEGGDKEAVMLFTSGSSGQPKGVALTHRNVIGNVTQVGTRLGLSGDEDRILGCLPLFHSFGSTITLWFPIIQGLGLVTHPSPLDTVKLAELAQSKKIVLLLSTPTFLRAFLKRAKPEQLKDVKLIVTGAEKLPTKLAEQFEARFTRPLLEGYGLTETSPVTHVNLPTVDSVEGQTVIPSHRIGSAGQLLPGMSIRITNPADNVDQSVFEAGMIWLHGPNVFNGYLNDKTKTREVLEDGWFRTGDIGRMDEDGFLFIEGRISRFSKIGGEMVPHERVEEEIEKALGLESQEERKIAVVGVPDESKGEALVLLSTVASDTVSQELIDLRYRLLEAGLPSLWIPKKLVPVEEIPVLASGKLDIKSCEELARLA